MYNFVLAVITIVFFSSLNNELFATAVHVIWNVRELMHMINISIQSVVLQLSSESFSAQRS